jgi:hypothetical protein
MYFIHVMKALLDDTYACVITIIFCCMPTSIAMIGVNIVLMLIPLMKTSELISKYKSKKKKTSTEHHMIEFLLHYWLSFACLWICRLYCFSFWPSVLMILSTGFQNQTFQGASYIIKEIQQVCIALAERNGRTSSTEEASDDPVDYSVTATPNSIMEDTSFTTAVMKSEEKWSPLEKASPVNLTAEFEDEAATGSDLSAPHPSPTK